MAEVDLVEVTKRYGAVEACSGVNLRIPEGEFVTLLGPSGCGKSTTLNMIAGLEEITAGDILMDGQRVNDLTPYERDVAMVFQQYALYPHMTVAENIGFTLKLRRRPKAADRGEGRSGGGPARAFALPRSPAARAFRWAAATCGAGAGDHSGAAAIPLRRALLQPRRRAAVEDAGRDQAPPLAVGSDLDLRDPRPGGGALHLGPDRGDAPGTCRAVRHTGGGLRPPRHDVRRALHWLPPDGYPAGRDHLGQWLERLPRGVGNVPAPGPDSQCLARLFVIARRRSRRSF